MRVSFAKFMMKQKFGFTKRVDKGWIATVKDLQSWRFKHFVRANDEGLNIGFLNLSRWQFHLYQLVW